MTDETELRPGIVRRCVVRISARAEEGWTEEEPDHLAVEEPLEIRVAGEPMAVTMRTPGDDACLALGFLFAEGVVEAMGEVGSVSHCGRPGQEGFGNVVDVLPAPGTALDPDRVGRARRGTLTTAACGVCGRRTVEDLRARCEPVAKDAVVPLQVLRNGTERLRERQPNFTRTGGIHGAAVVDPRGQVWAVAEDVGRHNAVDKVLGALLRAGKIGSGVSPAWADRPAVLVVSGRVSFEIVQKALVGGLVAVAGVSAPTSLAVDLADAMGLTLAGFVRGGALNVYAHAERLA